MKVFLLILTLVAACMMRSADGESIAFALADQETNPMYTADPSYVYNAGLPVNIKRDSPGNYRVFFNRLVGSGTHAQVTMYSTPSAAGWCNIHRVHPQGGLPAFTLRVRCFASTGSNADRKFLVLVIEGCGSSKDYLSYARLQSLSNPSYNAAGSWRFGDSLFPTDSSPVGLAVVDMGPVADVGAAVLATTYGSNRYCTIVGWNDGEVKVSCRNPAANLANSRSHVLAIKAGFRGVSFARNEGIPTGMLDPTYGYTSDGSPQTIVGGGGFYSVQIGPEAVVGGHVQVVAYDSEANCFVEEFGSGWVKVICAVEGVVVGSKFVVLAIK